MNHLLVCGSVGAGVTRVAAARPFSVWSSALAFVAFLCLAGRPAAAVTIDFSGLPTEQTALLQVAGADITATAANGAPGLVSVLNFNGLGVVGGGSDFFLGSTEVLRFEFTSFLAGDVIYRTNNIGNGDGDGFLGEARVEAFDFLGGSLGTFDTNGLGDKAVSAAFGNLPIRSFTISPLDNDSQIIAELSFNEITSFDVRWDRPDSGSWSSASNWFPETVPFEFSNVFIDPVASVTVDGPATATDVNSLQIGGGLGTATLDLGGAVITALSRNVTIAANGVLTGDGGIDANVENHGEIVAENVTVLGTITNHGIVRGGTVGAAKTAADLENAADGEVRVGNGERLLLDGAAHTNAGRIEVIAGEAEFRGSMTNSPDGEIVARNATLRFDNGLANAGQVFFSFGTSDVFGDITNTPTGSLINSGGGNVTFYDDIVNNGEVRTSSGAQSVFFGGYTGTGALTGAGSSFFEGGFSPGASPFLATASTDVSFGFTNVTLIELAGTTRAAGAASEYDGLDVTGGKILSLDGTLNVVLIDDVAPGYMPQAGDSFLIFTAASILGDFHTVNLPTLAADLNWLIGNDGRSYSLSVVAVPLPGGLWLLLSALGGLLLRRRV